MFLFVSDYVKVENHDMTITMSYRVDDEKTKVTLKREEELLWEHVLTKTEGSEVYFENDHIVLEAKDRENGRDVKIIFSLTGEILSRKDNYHLGEFCEGMITKDDFLSEIIRFAVGTKEGSYLTSMQIESKKGWNVRLDFSPNSLIAVRERLSYKIRELIYDLKEGDGVDIFIDNIFKPSQRYIVSYSYDNEVYGLWHKTIAIWR